MFSHILDSIDQQITVIDAQGNIKYVNQSWRDSFIKNGGKNNFDWNKQNYLSVCDTAAKLGDNISLKVLNGLNNLIFNKRNKFTLEYPCHSPTKESWYLIKAFPLKNFFGHFVVTHLNITENKVLENNAKESSIIDFLTGVYNRRGLELKSSDEFSRAKRSQSAIALCIFDIDNFKLFNDTRGHQAGDECLKSVANEIKHYAKRPGDIAARLGGDEFVLILANLTEKDVVEVAASIRDKVSALDFVLPNKNRVTISAGVISLIPLHHNSNIDYLYKYADLALYQAKKTRNSVCLSYPETNDLKLF